MADPRHAAFCGTKHVSEDGWGSSAATVSKRSRLNRDHARIGHAFKYRFAKFKYQFLTEVSHESFIFTCSGRCKVLLPGADVTVLCALWSWPWCPCRAPENCFRVLLSEWCMCLLGLACWCRSSTCCCGVVCAMELSCWCRCEVTLQGAAVTVCARFGAGLLVPLQGVASVVCDFVLIVYLKFKISLRFVDSCLRKLPSYHLMHVMVSCLA